MISSAVPKRFNFREFRLIYFIAIATMILVIPSISKSMDLEIQYNMNFIITNSIIGFVSFFMIALETRKSPYSLHLIHWLFHFTFFFLAPIVQYLNNFYPWYLLHSNDADKLIHTNMTILIWQLCWMLPRFLIRKKNHRKAEIINNPVYLVTTRKLLLLCFLSFVILVALIYIKGFSGLFIRASVGGDAQLSSAVWTLIMYSGRAIPVVFFVLSIIRYKSNRNLNNRITVIVAAVFALLTNFPTATPRFWTAALFLGLFLLLFKPVAKNILVYIMFFGLNILFPFLGSIRGALSVTEFSEKFDPSRLLSNNMLTADYDAFSMISYTWDYIHNFGVTYGNQLLTAIFFFVPRSIWPEKSVGSGHLVADHLNFVFNNVSSPLVAEGLINFGILGVILFSLMASKLCTEIDTAYWVTKKPLILIVYPFWIGLFFFIMRGDMLSSCGFTIGFTAGFFIFKPILDGSQAASVKTSSVNEKYEVATG